jgi:hypothetical protein
LPSERKQLVRTISLLVLLIHVPFDYWVTSGFISAVCVIINAPTAVHNRRSSSKVNHKVQSRPKTTPAALSTSTIPTTAPVAATVQPRPLPLRTRVVLYLCCASPPHAVLTMLLARIRCSLNVDTHVLCKRRSRLALDTLVHERDIKFHVLSTLCIMKVIYCSYSI